MPGGVFDRSTFADDIGYEDRSSDREDRRLDNHLLDEIETRVLEMPGREIEELCDEIAPSPSQDDVVGKLCNLADILDRVSKRLIDICVSPISSCSCAGEKILSVTQITKPKKKKKPRKPGRPIKVKPKLKIPKKKGSITLVKRTKGVKEKRR